MTHEEIQAAIKRLRKISNGARGYNALEFVEAVIPDGSWIDGLIDLLRQADPDTHMLLPVDANGEPIHVGDELCGYGRPDGGVYCKATNGYMVFVGEDGECAPKQWMVWDPDNCAHYHAPTIESVLRMFLAESEDAMRKGYDDVPDEIYAEYANKLREVMADDDAR